jgi:hypothetical protein
MRCRQPWCQRENDNFFFQLLLLWWCVAFREFSSLTTHFQPLIVCVVYTLIRRMSRTTYKNCEWQIQKEQQQSEAQPDGA